MFQTKLIVLIYLGLGLSCASVCSKLSIGVGIDEGLVPKSRLPASKMVEYMIQEFEDLKTAISLESQEANAALVV